MLEKENVHPAFVNPVFIKPMDTELIKRVAENHKHIIVVEEGIKKAVLEKALKLSYWKVELMQMFRLWQLMTGLWNRVTWLCLGKK